jgi:signal transduction histidine kinase
MQNNQIQLSRELQQQADLLKKNNDSLEQQKIQILEQSDGLKRLNDDKDLFISILAHDLKSPFTGILGVSELLANNIHKYDNDKIKNLIILLNKSAVNSYKLLEDLLMWAQSQSGQLPFGPQKLFFIEVCSEIVEILKLNANEKKISINIFAEDNITVFADKEMLKTVLRNLISNAIKFSKEEGIINVYALQNQNSVTITVSDNGVGIASDLQQNLFSISHKNSTIGTANEKGTGFGLLLCKDFVEKHSGEIWVKSEIGKGSEFKFFLPS